MAADAARAIRAEHDNMARVLACLEDAVADIDAGADAAALDLIYSIVYYLRVFPDRLHHPKEEAHLFEALRRRAPECAPLLDELSAQHGEGERRLAVLKDAVEACERDPEVALVLQRAARGYITFLQTHMRKEEDEVLPLAEAKLTAQDWRDIARAFARNDDPLFGENLQRGFEALYERILSAGDKGKGRARR
ncbi:MAG: hemerythrin domain-containing protein [Kiloniellaceae bacterium]